MRFLDEQNHFASIHGNHLRLFFSPVRLNRVYQTYSERIQSDFFSENGCFLLFPVVEKVIFESYAYSRHCKIDEFLTIICPIYIVTCKFRRRE